MEYNFFFLAIHQTLYYDYGQLRLKYFTFTVCYKQVDKYNIRYNKRIYSYISISSYIFHIYFFLCGFIPFSVMIQG